MVEVRTAKVLGVSAAASRPVVASLAVAGLLGVHAALALLRTHVRRRLRALLWRVYLRPTLVRWAHTALSLSNLAYAAENSKATALHRPTTKARKRSMAASLQSNFGPRKTNDSKVLRGA